MLESGNLTQSIAKDSPIQIFLKPSNKVVTTLALVLIGLSFFLVNFHLFSAYFGQSDARLHRSIHLTVILILAFLYYPIGRKSWNSPLNSFFLIDLILIYLTLMVHIYTCWDFSNFRLREANQFDIIIGIICIFLVLEATRRTIGWIMTLIAGFFLFQTLYSDLLFGIFYGPPMSWKTTIDFLFMQAVGIYGVPLMAMSSYIILFIIFGSVLAQSGGGKFFIDLATALTGDKRGGPAQTAVVASAIMGTISGSAVANVVTTGAFTIPLMKRTGYKAEFAAAVEALASCGGQIMPPIMGASAFLIAEFMGVPYLKVIAAAFIPAILYFFSIFVMVNLEASKKGLRVLKKEELPNLNKVLKKGVHLIIPLVAIIFFLIKGYTVMMAGFWGVVTVIFITLIKKDTRMSFFQFLETFEKATKSAIPVAAACATAGLIVGSIEISGVGIKFSGLIIDLSGGNLLIALVLTMFASLILGMGLPTVAIYVTLSAIVVPALIKMGVYPMAAHLFVFYFGVLGFVTPPVCVAAFAAAAIAKAKPMATGFTATRLGIAGYIVPFIFAYDPTLLFVGTIWKILWSVITAIIGVSALGGGVQGWWFGKINIIERIFFITASILLVNPESLTDIIGLSILGILILNMLRRKKLLEKVV